MKEYHKIVTVWERNAEDRFKTLIEGKWAEPEFSYLKDNDWIWTEKIDGTNVRVIFDEGKTVSFQGKTDNAQLHANLINYLQGKFYSGVLEKLFDGPACLYGEGFGAKIQKGGGNYFSDHCEFCLFDVRIGNVWLERPNLEDIANKLEIPIVPIVGIGTLSGAINKVKEGFNSSWGDFLAEGLVMKPQIELLNRRGHRVITKIKHKDFK